MIWLPKALSAQLKDTSRSSPLTRIDFRGARGIKFLSFPSLAFNVGTLRSLVILPQAQQFHIYHLQIMVVDTFCSDPIPLMKSQISPHYQH
jgi:hypothetical protein